MRAKALAVAILAAAVAIVAAYRLHHDARKWNADAAIYLRMTLADRGVPLSRARAEADRFILTTSERNEPASRGFYGAAPPRFYVEQFRLFRTRPLYPFAAAQLYPRFGPRALQIVSALAYVGATIAMCAILFGFVPAWLAALGAFAFATAPPVLDVTALGLTDALAMLWWICALSGIIAYARRPSRSALALAAVASLALAFTRPAAYLPLGAALGAALALRRTGADRRVVLAPIGVTLAVALAFVAYGAAVHGPGLAEQVRWQYAWQRATGVAAAAHGSAGWYARAELSALLDLATVAIYKSAALFPLTLAAFGAVLIRPRATVAVLGGAAAATLIAVVVNPLEIQRTVELPLTPIVVILATVALRPLARLAGRRAGGFGFDGVRQVWYDPPVAVAGSGSLRTRETNAP